MRLSFVALALLSGCSLFDPLDVRYRPGFADVGTEDDATSLDASSDARVDADADLGVADASSDASSSDASSDAAPDMPGDVGVDASADVGTDQGTPGCLTDLPRQGLSKGLTCEVIPIASRTPACDIVEQTGCPAQEYCSSFFNPNVMEVTIACTAGRTTINPTCEFVGAGDVCVRRTSPSDPPESIAVCEPGTVCGGLRAGEIEGYCREYCILKSGLGCPPNLYCAQADPKLTEYGFGRCFADVSACP